MKEFIKVTKDDVTIEVHPDALKNHLEIGWKIVEPDTIPDLPQKAEAVVDKPVKKKADK